MLEQGSESLRAAAVPAEVRSPSRGLQGASLYWFHCPSKSIYAGEVLSCPVLTTQ